MQSKIKLLSWLPLYKLNRLAGWPKLMPINLTLSITADCNSRCLTCNIWKKRENDLTLDEWQKILATLGRRPFWITLSGGEPFLKNYLVDLVRHCYQINRPAIINIPTNCLLADIIPQKVETMCQFLEGTQLVINLSLDGLHEKHDQLRGVENNFAKVIKTYEELKTIKKIHKNLTVGFHTVISNYNIENLPELFEWVIKMQPDQYITEIAEQRAELDNQEIDLTPTWEKYSEIIDKLKKIIKEQKYNNFSKITEAFRLEYYQLTKNYLKSKKQPLPCYAGFASAQIYAQGNVWECCIEANSLGNLRESNYNFPSVWHSKKADIIRKKIKSGACACPLANASYTNMLFNRRSLFSVLKNYFTL